MANLKYVVNRVVNMDYGSMLRIARTVRHRTGKNTLGILIDIIRCGMKYEAGYMDYLVFEFYQLTDAQRATYITRGVSNSYVRLFNPRVHWHILEDKVEALRRFGELSGRDWIDIRESGREGFEEFCVRHQNLVVKPIDGTCGKGLDFIETSDHSRIVGLYDMLMQEKQYLVEEHLQQHEDLNKLYPLSVNTLRLVTMTVGQDVYLMFHSIRLGNGKRVDNLNSGGLAALIDPDTGCISTPGADKDGYVFESHPITGTRLVGAKIPFFEESVEMVKKAALRIPEMGYIAWDVAVTPKGPSLIEANHFPGHDIYQFQAHLGPDRIGLKPRFDQIAALKMKQ